jgi:hypothetical protein
MNIDPKQYPKLARLVDKHEKNIDAFQAQATAFFHPYAVALCRRIQQDIPEFEGCQLAMRMLFLEPRDLPITVVTGDTGEKTDERLANIIDGGYIDNEGKGVCHWHTLLPERCQQAMRELDALSNYIDDNYSMVGDLEVTLADEPALPPARKPSAVKEHKRLMKMDFNRIAANIRTYHTTEARWRHINKYLPLLKASNPRFNKARFIAACLS